MKFVINRVHKDSAWTEDEVQGREVAVESLRISLRGNGFLYGDCLIGDHTYYTVNGFTITEIDEDGNML